MLLYLFVYGVEYSVYTCCVAVLPLVGGQRGFRQIVNGDKEDLMPGPGNMKFIPDSSKYVQNPHQ